jgi:serine/threonine protein phosphatase PrpC
VRVGWCTERGQREANEDYVGVWTGTAGQRARRGIVAAVADGVGGAPGGRVAAETAVRAFIDFYLSQPDTLGVRRAVARAAEAVNGWVHDQGRRDPRRLGMATTLTALVLHGRQAHLLHVGDSRLYRLRDGRLARLTQDHVHDGPDRAHVLRRAVGLDDALRADYAAEPLAEQDRLVLTTDGVHGALREAEMRRLLGAEATPEAAARRLVATALRAGSGGADNATALVADVVALPVPDRDALELASAALPILEPPAPGERVDGFLVGEPLADGRYSRLHRAVDPTDGGRALVLKFPKPAAADDATHRLAFVREGWVGARVRSPWLGEVLELAPGRRTRLYSVMPHYAGETLEERIGRGPPVPLAQGVAIGVRLAKALTVLHRAGVIHRDVKPENVILEAGGGLRLIDLGVVRLPGVEEFPPASAPGTASYMAPELLAGGAPGDERSDLYALGVTLYRLFTGACPYGEVEPFQPRKRFGAPVPLQRRRPDLPAWLDIVLARAVAVAPEDRPGDAVELALELEAGAARPTPPVPRKPPLLARDPVGFWQAVSLLLLLLLALSAAIRP